MLQHVDSCRSSHIYKQLTLNEFSNYNTRLLYQPSEPSYKKVCGPQECCWEKRCEIRSGGQEMAVMVG